MTAPAAIEGVRRPTIAHVPALDGLRGLAVIAVLLFHAGHLTGGYLGVDLFFVLSGFLITRLLLAESERDGTVHLGAFWARRARRLLPALLLVLVAVAAYAAIALDGAELERVRRDALATIVYLANWEALAAGRDYWSLFAEPSPLEHMWSLAIEEQFYVVWPLVVLALLRWRRSPVAVLAVSLVGAAASAAWAMALHVPGGGGARSYLGTDTRAAAILLGAALAAWVTWRGPPGADARTGRRWEVAGWGAAAVLGVAWVGLSGTGDLLFRGGLLACGVAATVVIAAASRPDPGPLARALSWRPLRAAGLVSYGLYLWHWPVYVVLDADRTGLADPALTVVRVAVSVALAVASYVLVERPVRRGAVRVAAPAFAVATPLAVALLVLVATRAPTGTTQSATGAIGESVSAERTVVEPEATAVSAPPPAPPTVLVLGDELAARVGAVLDAAGVGEVAVSSAAGCGLDGPPAPAPGLPAPEVDPWAPTATPLDGPCEATERARRALVAELDPDVIVLAHAGDARLVRRALDADRRACDVVFNSWYEQRLHDRIDRLAATGAAVAVATVPTDAAPEGATTEAGCLSALRRIAGLERADAVVLDLEEWAPDTWAERAGDAIDEVVAAAGEPWDVFLVGDSTALRLGEGFRTDLVAGPVVFGFETRLGCGILPGDTIVDGTRVDGALCRGAVESWFERLDGDPADVTVMLTGAWEIFDHVLADGTRAAFASPAWDAAVRDALEGALAGLAARSERVVALTLPCFAQGDAGVWDLDVRNDPARVERFNRHLRDAAAATGVEVVDLGALLCPDGRPLDQLDGVPLRYDGVHLTREGAGLVWRWLLPRLGAPGV
jgi:peptidoglycan/LPS O-acetylase OafA/YrhL